MTDIIVYKLSIPSDKWKFKLKFPEDVAKNLLTQEVLKDYRETGIHIIKQKTNKRKTTRQ